MTDTERDALALTEIDADRRAILATAFVNYWASKREKISRGLYVWGILLTIASVASIVLPAILAAHDVDALTSAERRLFAQAWHLRALVPEEAAAAARASVPAKG
jgi:hypothetical protein